MIVFFDLDGTLINSSARHQILLRELLIGANVGYDEEILKTYDEYKRDGNNTYRFLTNIMKLNEDIALKISNEWKEHIELPKYLQMDKLYEETFLVLNYLKSKQIPIVYISARSNKVGIEEELKYLGIFDYARDVFIVDSKKAYENKYNVMKQISRPSDLIVGDTEVEFELSQALQLNSIILNRGFRSKKYWDNLQVQSFDTILAPLMSIC